MTIASRRYRSSLVPMTDHLTEALRTTPHKHFGTYPTWILMVNDQGVETGEVFVDFPPIFGARHTDNGRSMIVVLDEVQLGPLNSVYRQRGIIVNTREIVNLN